jgi:diguanylate cyclase (GGDEF)-like protein
MSISLAELPNKESLEVNLVAQMEGGRTVSAVFVDLDGFKQVNDQLGHAEGDRCLVEVAAAMSKVIDDKGRLYRVGGDEFCIMLLNPSGSDATADAEQVRLSIDQLKPFGGTTKVTASIGVATSCAKLTDAKALIAAADEAMYVSKWTTKNCVTTWPPPEAARQRADLAKLDHRVGSLQVQIATQDKRAADETQRRQGIVEELAKLLQRGREIRDKVEYNNLSHQEVTNWKQHVAQYLTENLGEPFAVRFRNPSHQITQYPPHMVPAMRVHWAGLTECMMMLNDFMAENRF